MNLSRSSLVGKKSAALPLAIIALMAVLLLAAIGCGGEVTPGGNGSAQGGSFQAKGSDTMVNLSQMWAEKYMEENPQVNIAVTGGGSGTGISAIINGTTDVANASRAMKDKEKDEARGKGIDVVENRVALDGLATIVHPGNKVQELSIDQLADIFTGKITDWSDVGGDAGEIVLLSRESNSGTHVFYKEHVLNKGKSDGTAEFAPNTLLMPSSQAIVDELAQNPNAIGYVGLGYVTGEVRALKVKKDAASAAVAPTLTTVQDDSYPISRPLFVITKKDAPPAVTDFLEWIQGAEGQKIVEELEFVPLKK